MGEGAISLCILNFILFSFSRRGCNTVAHELAKLGASSEFQDSVRVDESPSCIVNLLASDSAMPEVYGNDLFQSKNRGDTLRN